MNQITQTGISSQALEKAKSIDQVAAGAMSLFEQAGSFEAELALAGAIGQMRALLTADVMQPVMALMNTDLGFRTDRDPNLIDQKTGKPNQPYAVETVREVFIEAKLRGFHTAGNEFNIISGRFYGAKNGFRRKVTRFPGLSQFKDIYDVPRTVGDKGAIVKARASWVLAGAPDSMEIEIPVRINAYMGTDAILGKAERKLLKRVHDRITGQNTPEGEVGEEVNVSPDAGPQKAAPIMQAKPTQTAAPVETIDASGAPAIGPKQKELKDMMDRAGVPFDDFRSWCLTTGFWPEADSIDAYERVPDALVDKLAKDTKAISKIITIYGKKGGGK